jgi:hypothetical protein
MTCYDTLKENIMKTHIITGLIIILIILSTEALFPEGPGDVNNDNVVDIVDALLTAQFYVGLNPSNFNQNNADINSDGQINIVDALIIAQIYVGLATSPPTPAPTPSSVDNVYMFSYFTGDGDDGLHLAYSYDCQNWTALKNGGSFLTPQIGDRKMRDPSIQRDSSGIFHCVWTDTSWTEMGENNQANKGFGYASSSDLINWSGQRFIGVMEGTRAENTWAPELFWDDTRNEWMVLWSSTVLPANRHRIYYATTTDFTTFSSTQVLFDPGYTVIDSAIFKYSDGRYGMVFKDEDTKGVCIVESSSPRGSWGSRTIIYNDVNVEGPSPAHYGNYWYVAYDKYTSGSYGISRSTNLTSWSTISCSFPSGVRHGTIFMVSEDFLNSLRAKL